MINLILGCNNAVQQGCGSVRTLSKSPVSGRNGRFHSELLVCHFPELTLFGVSDIEPKLCCVVWFWHFVIPLVMTAVHLLSLIGKIKKCCLWTAGPAPDPLWFWTWYSMCTMGPYLNVHVCFKSYSCICNDFQRAKVIVLHSFGVM